MRAGWIRGACACLLFAFAGMVFAQLAAGPSVPEGPPSTDQELRDREFGVGTRQFGLQRKVEMYQWRRLGPGYRKVWDEQAIDSSAYAETYRNPGALPMQTRYWVATRVQLDGKPVDEDVLKQLGRWRDFRPGFSALPGNLAATFQPEGDGLGSAENPLDPQIGDLRVTWRELTLPDLSTRLVLQRGVWILKPDTAVAAVPANATASPARSPDVRAQGRYRDALPIGIGALVVIVAIVVLRRRRS